MNTLSPRNKPELEQDFQRNSSIGYEPEGSYGFLRCLEHGAPNPHIRWHQHEELSDFAHQKLIKIKNSTGIKSFNEFLLLILELSKHDDYQLLSNEQLQSFDDDDSMNRFSGVIDYITENYNADFSMTDIAEKMGMDSSQFSRCFKKASGNTFTGFVNRLRVNRACQLLTETDKYISTICYHVGYNNVANFNRRFVEIKKITPSEYRKQSQLKFG